MFNIQRLLNIETTLACLGGYVVLLHTRNRCRRGTLVQVLDELLDRIVTALCLALYLCGFSAGTDTSVLVLTLPSGLFVTKPVTPMLLACLCV